MSHQVTDPFIWNNEEWIFLGAKDVYSLFDPKKYGLTPSSPNTACWKGFIVKFVLKDGFLYLDSLAVHCENNIYPPINGVKPKIGIMRMHEYKNLNIELKYSGTIVVGQSMKPEFKHRAFTGPHSYETTYELEIKDGRFVGSRDTSGTYFGF